MHAAVRFENKFSCCCDAAFSPFLAEARRACTMAAAISGKSMFGVQAPSKRHSAPSYGFGSGTRNHRSKLFVGSEHAKTSSISITPGPCYENIDSVGTQADSGKSSYPQWAFGTQDRFSGTTRKRTPGPGSYENETAFGKQGLSSRTDAALWGFGTSNRHNTAKVFISQAHEKSKHGLASPGPAALYQHRGALEGPEYGFGTDDRFQRLGRQLADSSELPGPGSYAHDSTFNTQHSSSRRTDSRYGFGSSNREHQAKTFLSEFHAKSSPGAHPTSPGPAVYNSAPSIGVQATTRGKSASSWGFGTDTRFKAGAYANGSPGPGSYSI